MTPKKPLELSDRPCLIANINPRVERHGDEDVPAVDIKLTGITLGKLELIRLTGDPQAWNLMFVQAKAGDVIEPALQWCDGWRYLPQKWVDCNSLLRFGMQKTEHELENHKIKSAAVRALTGGQAELMCTLQLLLEDDTSIMSRLTEYQGKEGHIALTFGEIDVAERKQGKLALNDEADKDEAARKRDDEDRPSVQ